MSIEELSLNLETLRQFSKEEILSLAEQANIDMDREELLQIAFLLIDIL